MEVFRTLMAWRRTPLSPDRVKALNMVEIEFHGVKSVETAYGELFRHFQTQITEENSVVWHEANPQYRARACQRCQPSPCRARRRRLGDKIRRRLSVHRPAGIGASCLSPVLQGALSFPDSLLRPCSTFDPQCDTSQRGVRQPGSRSYRIARKRKRETMPGPPVAAPSDPPHVRRFLCVHFPQKVCALT
jgi:hypothetical protein